MSGMARPPYDDTGSQFAAPVPASPEGPRPGVVSADARTDWTAATASDVRADLAALDRLLSPEGPDEALAVALGRAALDAYEGIPYERDDYSDRNTHRIIGLAVLPLLTAERERAARLTQVVDKALALVAEASGWIAYDTRDIGSAYDADAVDELLSDLRAALSATDPGSSDERHR